MGSDRESSDAIFYSAAVDDTILDRLLDPSQMPDSIPKTSYDGGDCLLSSESKELKNFLKSPELALAGTLLRQPINKCDDYNFIHPKFVRTIIAGSRYVNDEGSLYGCSEYRSEKAKRAILTQFRDELSDFADSVDDQSAAKCFLNLFATMANKGSFTKGEDSGAVKHQRLWAVGSTAVIFIKNYEFISQFGFYQKSENKLENIRNWMGQLGQMVYEDSLRIRELRTNNSSQVYEPTNMQLSRSFALLNSSILSNNQTHLKEAKKIYKEAIKHVTDKTYALYEDPSDKGYLIAEMRRGRRAQSYHSTSLFNILAIRSISRAADCNFNVSKNGNNIVPSRIAYLFRKTAEGGHFIDANGDKVIRNPDVFPEHLKRMAMSDGAIPAFSMNPNQYNKPQATTKNVDGLALLLPRDENSTDFEILTMVNKYLTNRGYPPLQADQKTSTYRRKLGGDIANYPKRLSLLKRSNVFNSNSDASDDFMALLRKDFCQ